MNGLPQGWVDQGDLRIPVRSGHVSRRAAQDPRVLGGRMKSRLIENFHNHLCLHGGDGGVYSVTTVVDCWDTTDTQAGGYR